MEAELAETVAEILLEVGDREWGRLARRLTGLMGDDFVRRVRSERTLRARGDSYDVTPLVDVLKALGGPRARELGLMFGEFDVTSRPPTANHISGGTIQAPVVQTGSGTVHVHMPAPPTGDRFDFRGSTFNGSFTGVRQGSGDQPAAEHSGPEDWPSARNAEPLALGVRSTRRVKGLPALPPYVGRDKDGELHSVLRQTGVEGGLVVVLGEAFAGKTRTALAAMTEALADFRVYAPPRHENLRGLPALLRGASERCVVWLDDLDGHLGDGGLEPRLLAHLTERRAVVLATLREDAYDEYRHTSRGRVLDLAHVVEVPREWNTAERGRAERADDRRLAEAAARSGAEGIAAYLAVGPLLWEEWRRAGKADRHPRGHLLVRAATDLARCGLWGPLSRELLIETYKTYEALPGAERESVDDALAWAAEKRHGVLRLLRPSGPTAWEASPYLVDAAAQEPGFPPVDLAVWKLALEAARTDSTYDLETVTSGTEAALRTVAEDGDSQAMHELGLLLESLDKGEEAEPWLRRAAEAGNAESAGRLGRRLVERGATREAEPYLEKAAEDGDPEAALLLGKLLRDRAVDWLGKGAEAGNPEAAHRLGDLLFMTEADGVAWELYEAAVLEGHAEVATSMGAHLLVYGEREHAQIWLSRAAAAGDARAARLSLDSRPTRRSLDDVADYFASARSPLHIANLGNVLERQGRIDEALAKYAQAHELGDAYGAYCLAALHQKRGKPDEARHWYRAAADMGHEGARRALDTMPDTVEE